MEQNIRGFFSMNEIPLTASKDTKISLIAIFILITTVKLSGAWVYDSPQTTNLQLYKHTKTRSSIRTEKVQPYRKSSMPQAAHHILPLPTAAFYSCLICFRSQLYVKYWHYPTSTPSTITHSLNLRTSNSHQDPRSTDYRRTMYQPHSTP